MACYIQYCRKEAKHADEAGGQQHLLMYQAAVRVRGVSCDQEAEGDPAIKVHYSFDYASNIQRVDPCCTKTFNNIAH